MSFDPVLIWFLVGLALILAEFMIPGVILIFFGVGAWLTALTAWLGMTPGWTSQLLAFAISSVVMLVLLRRWFRTKFFGYVEGGQNSEDNLDDLAGHEVVVSQDIQPGETGKVEYKGAAWSARSDVPLSAGEPAVITRTEGITLIVRPRS